MIMVWELKGLRFKDLQVEGRENLWLLSWIKTNKFGCMRQSFKLCLLPSCHRFQEGYCDVALFASNFDIGAPGDVSDSMSIGTNLFTGNSFGGSLMLNCECEEAIYAFHCKNIYF